MNKNNNSVHFCIGRGDYVLDLLSKTLDLNEVK